MELQQVLMFLGLCVSMTAAHMCLLSPPQRGSETGLDKQASPDCGLTTPPCGGRPPQLPLVVPSGQYYNLVVQKNLDHYNATNPGYFSFSSSANGTGEYMEYLRIPDKGEPSLHLYTNSFLVPTFPQPTYWVTQVRYVTNTDAGTFYQCADVVLYSQKQKSVDPKEMKWVDFN